MAEMVRHTHTAGSVLTPEQIARVKKAEQYPIIFDRDCPELTDEQLAEFQPVNFASWEERARVMRAAGIVDPEATAEPVPVVAGK
ncbi:hypothetical protein AGMMS50293_00750 [Spirochaetia bacterium]|nr:hypothetical protein AGMMS50293_00750 [Spirochaetia bacterium]